MTTHQQHVLYSRVEAAAILRVSLSTIGREIRAGNIKTFRAGRSIRITEASLQAYMNGETPETPAPEGREDSSTFPPTPSLFYSPETED